MLQAAHLSRGEQKSLAYHKVIAERISADPALIEIARARLQWYRRCNPAGASYYRRWDELLSGSIDDLLNVLVGTSDDCCALRQENPFVDLISQTERAAIYRRIVREIDRIEDTGQ